MTSLTPKGQFSIAKSEAVVVARYKDQAGIDTWGIGHTAAAGKPFPGTMSFSMPTDVDAAARKAWGVFLSDLSAYSDAVDAALGDLAPHERDGWTMWHFNTGGIRNTGAVKKWRAGDKAGAVAVLTQWKNITRNGRKVVSDGLVKRRAEEAAIILKGIYPKGKIAVLGTDGKGRVNWTPLSSVAFDAWFVHIGTPLDAFPVPELARRRAAERGSPLNPVATTKTTAPSGVLIQALISAIIRMFTKR